MKRLTLNNLDITSKYILNNARYLEKLMFGHYFIQPCPDKIVKALQLYQNKDGGYGNALEPDFRLPSSSAQATLHAFRILENFDKVEGAIEQIQKALGYLESTYNPVLKGWESVPKIVNLYPHAPWWHYNSDVILLNGNPSVELLGYMLKYSPVTKQQNYLELIVEYIQQFIEREECEVHELYNFIRLYKFISTKKINKMLTGMLDNLHQKFISKLIFFYEQNVNLEINEWSKYVAYPLKFIECSEDNILLIPAELIDINLDYLIDQINQFGYISPSWNWNNQDLESWQSAKHEWTGVLTLEVLKLLKKFGRIQKNKMY